MTFNAPRNRRSTEIDDDEPPIVSNCTWKILHLDEIPEMVNIVDGFQFRNNPPPRPSVLTASFKVVAAARTSTYGI